MKTPATGGKFLHPGNNKGEAAYHIEILNNSNQDKKQFTIDVEEIYKSSTDATYVAPTEVQIEKDKLKK